MSEMPWVKMYTEMLDDTKLGRLNNALRWRFVSLILLAGECDAEGYITNGSGAMSTDDIAWRLRTKAYVLAKELATLENVGLIANTSNGWKVIKFSERQGRTQSEKREMWRQRQSKHRAADRGPEWKSEETPEETPPVTKVSRVTHAAREEKSRERVEKSREDNGAEVPAPQPPLLVEPLTVGQRQFLEAFNAKRFKNSIQRELILNLEKSYGTSKLAECVQWAAKRGMGLGEAVSAIEKAIPKWGAAKPTANGKTSASSDALDAFVEASRGNA
jgi:hypothetical protein